MKAPDAHECLSDEQLLALASGDETSARRHVLLLELERCADCRLLLEEAAAQLRAEGSTGSTGSAEISRERLAWGPLARGERVGARYRIERQLGQGGMGVVYLAVDLELDERVALKVLHGDLADQSTTLVRFKRELQLARRVVHPNVCRMLEWGRAQHGGGSYYFLTMELLEGQTMAEWLRRHGPMPESLAVSLGLQICAGLAAIHRAGILHRDIKPQNVMLLPDGKAPRAVLLDFGVARSLRGFDGASGRQPEGLPFDAQLFQTRGSVGTPLYMAPEQVAQGSAVPATDLYAVGLVLYEMLTARRPEQPGCPPAALTCPRAPGAEDGPSEAVAAVVLDCLQLQPEQRPPDAEHVAARLREAVAMGRGTLTLRRARWLRRTVQFAAPGLAALLLSFFFWPSRSSQTTQRVEASWVTPERQRSPVRSERPSGESPVAAAAPSATAASSETLGTGGEPPPLGPHALSASSEGPRAAAPRRRARSADARPVAGTMNEGPGPSGRERSPADCNPGYFYAENDIKVFLPECSR